MHAITSLKADKTSPETFLNLCRNHWAIENQLHRSRDMIFNEDRSTIRKGGASQVMAALRNTAIQICRRTKLSLTYAVHIGSRFPNRMIKLLAEN